MHALAWHAHEICHQSRRAPPGRYTGRLAGRLAGWLGKRSMKWAVCLPTSCRRVDQVLKRFERGEIERVDWLDGLTMRAIDSLRRGHHAQQLQAQQQEGAAGAGTGAGEAATGAVSPSGLQLSVELLSFPLAVVFQQAAVAGHALPPLAASSTGDALGTPLPGTLGTGVVVPAAAGTAAAAAADASSGGSVILLLDSEVG